MRSGDARRWPQRSFLHFRRCDRPMRETREAWCPALSHSCWVSASAWGLARSYCVGKPFMNTPALSARGNKIRRAPVADVAAPTTSSKPDPIFAAIDLHRKAEAEWQKACYGYEDAKDADFSLLEKSDSLRRKLDRIAINLSELKPTSVEGCAALVSYVLESAAEARWSVSALESTVNALNELATTMEHARREFERTAH
jgi:hypothetical protein